jgi:hypothetical protein
MSEFQYYEFRAIDRSLAQRETRELRAISTRAEITPTSFVNTYEWGDLKGDPNRFMEKYFDAFVYVANWGTREFMHSCCGFLKKRLTEEQSPRIAGETISMPHG